MSQHLQNLQGEELSELAGIKYDQGKAPLGMIPSVALIEEANVLAFGAEKYDRDNWRKGMKWSRLLDAALRHITAYNEGEANDEESGISHLAHARCCLGFLLHYAKHGTGEDDRPTG